MGLWRGVYIYRRVGCCFLRAVDIHRFGAPDLTHTNPCQCTPMQVGELAAVVAEIKAEYDKHEARLKERLDRLKARAGGAQAGWGAGIGAAWGAGIGAAAAAVAVVLLIANSSGGSILPACASVITVALPGPCLVEQPTKLAARLLTTCHSRCACAGVRRRDCCGHQGARRAGGAQDRPAGGEEAAA